MPSICNKMSPRVDEVEVVSGTQAKLTEHPTTCSDSAPYGWDTEVSGLLAYF